MRLHLKAGQVRYARVPFTENPNDSKNRPVIVLGWSPMGAGEDQVVLVVPVTSFKGDPKPRNGHIELDWGSAGLSKRSWAAARRVWGADPRAFDGAPIGQVTQSDMTRILLEIEHILLPDGF